ncbi:MAG TPA: MFS transporter [Myxococcota bacterium]|nr:MFS transporter [Myxococcota bacterium]
MTSAPPSEAQRLQANIRKLSLLSASQMFLVVMPVIVPFYRAHGLDMREVYLLQSVFAVATLLLEVPSGYAADLLGRKKTLITGSLFYGVSFTWLALANGFLGFVVFELLAAVGVALFSGTDVALLYASLDERSEGGGQGARAIGSLLFASQLGETAAALLCGVLVGVSLHLPVAVNAATAWLPLGIALTLHEPTAPRMKRGQHAENLRAVARALFGQGRLLRLLLANQVLYSTATLVAVWAFQAYWSAQAIPMLHFGWLWATQNLAVALTARVAHRAEGEANLAPSAALIAGLAIIGFFGMALCGGWTGVACGLAFSPCRAMNQVVMRHAINVRMPEPMRATANSVAALGMRLLFAAVGPLFGYAMDRLGPAGALRHAGWVSLGIALTVSLPLVREARAQRAV